MEHAALAYWLARDARSASSALDLNPDALHSLATRRMRAMLVDARRSPFHDSRMRAAGLSRSEALRDVDLPLALRSLSPVTKHDLRAAGNAALRDGRASAQWFSSQSSGSSGEPFRVYYDARAWSMLKYLVKMRARRAAGVMPSDRVAILDAVPISAEGHSLLERAGRVRRISIFRSPAEIATLLADYRPDAIYALPSALLEVARAMKSGAPQVRAARVFTSGELLAAGARLTITAALGGMLFDVYGTSETKEIAWECEAGSRHINADVVYVEILDEQGAVVPTGADGEIVVTLLVNRAMPLVRYRTGDRGSMLPSRCSCGRGSPLLGVISGRDSDTLELPDGSTRSPYQLTMALELVPELAQYQIVQVQRDLLRVSAVAIAHTRHDVSTLEREIHDALREVLPRDVFVEVTIVERLARGPREKLRAVHPLPRSHESLAALATIPGALE